jgi:radical SAM protein with 4Fe4S-binding SPASM domain
MQRSLVEPSGGSGMTALPAQAALERIDPARRVSFVDAAQSPDDVLAAIKGQPYLEYRKKWARAGRFEYVPDFPIHLDVDTNYSCNLDCIMCPQGVSGFPVAYPRKFLDFNLYQKVMHECAHAGLASVRLGITGEPLLRPDILDFVRVAQNLGILDIMLITNGMLLDADMSAALIDSGLTHLMVSVDAARPETYNRIRPGGDLDKLKRNVDTFLNIRAKHRSRLPLIRVSFIRMSLNRDEQKEFERYWSGRADYLVFQEYANILGQKNTAYFAGPKPLAGGFRCPDPWQRMALFVNGDLFPCCADFGRLTPLGNANVTTVKDIWRARGAERLRDIHRRGQWNDHPSCRLCVHASMDPGKA